MSNNEIKTTELAKELGVKATQVVKALEKLLGVQYKKGTTNLKIKAEDAQKIKEMLKAEIEPEQVIKPTEPQPAKEARKKLERRSRYKKKSLKKNSN
jgi:hypothetical protein